MIHYIYQITNLINEKIYIGRHSTNNVNDGYMGSGTALHKAYLKYGIENFKKQILYYCESITELLQLESDIVNESFIKQKNVYNMELGGFGYLPEHFFAKDKNEKYHYINKNDDKWKSGEYISPNKNMVTVIDVNNNIFQVSINDERYLSGELISTIKNNRCLKDINGKYKWFDILDLNDKLPDGYEYVSKNTKMVKDLRTNTYTRIKIDEFNSIYENINTGQVTVKDTNNNYFKVSVDDEKYLTGELMHISKGVSTYQDNLGNKYRLNVDDEKIQLNNLCGLTKGKCAFKDINENIVFTDINDLRVINGELVGINKGKIIVKDKYNNCLLVEKNDERYLTGELKHISKGKLTVKDINGNTFRIDVNDKRLQTGEVTAFNKGRTWKQKPGISDRLKNKVLCRNIITNETVTVLKTDPKYLSGEVIGINKGRIKVIDENGQIFTTYNSNPKYLSGEYKRFKK